MLKRIGTCALILFALLAAACGPATVDVQSQGQVAVGGTQTPAIYYTDTSAPPTQTSIPPTSAAFTSTPEIQVQINGSAAATMGLEGTWQITAFASSSTSALGDTNAQAYLGKQAVITSDSISFDGQTCANVSVQRHTVSLAGFLGLEYATLAAKLGLIQDQIDLIDTTCTVTGFQSFVQADPNTLVININGTFFVMRK